MFTHQIELHSKQCVLHKQRRLSQPECNTDSSYMVAVILYSIAMNENLFTTYVSQKGWNRYALLFSVFIQVSNKMWSDGDYTIMPHMSQLELNQWLSDRVSGCH